MGWTAAAARGAAPPDCHGSPPNAKRRAKRWDSGYMVGAQRKNAPTCRAAARAVPEAAPSSTLVGRACETKGGKCVNQKTRCGEHRCKEREGFPPPPGIQTLARCRGDRRPAGAGRTQPEHPRPDRGKQPNLRATGTTQLAAMHHPTALCNGLPIQAALWRRGAARAHGHRKPCARVPRTLSLCGPARNKRNGSPPFTAHAAFRIQSSPMALTMSFSSAKAFLAKAL